VLEGPFSEDFKSFVAACLVKDPTKRPSAAALLKHPFIAAVTGIPDGWAAFVRALVHLAAVLVSP
jgi:serine/threonine protein kinase